MPSWPQSMLVFAIIAIRPPAMRADEPRSEAAEMLERLRTEAVVQWRAMARESGQCEFEYTIVETERDGKLARSQTKRVVGHVAGECFLLTETIVATDQTSVCGRNERYEFALSRDGKGPWTIVWQGALGGEDTPVESTYAYLAGMLHLPWSISATPLEKLVNDPSFSIDAVRRRDDGRVQVDFSVAGAVENGLQGLSSGVLVLDPNRRWTMTEYRADYASKLSSSAKLAYTKSGPPELRHVRFELRTSPERTSEFAIDVGKYDWARGRCSEITLAAFGLPEYHAPAERRRWLRLVNIGIILILVGLILWCQIHGRLAAR